MSMPSRDAIFLLDVNDRLERVDRATFAAEDILQELIAKRPELLVGEQLDPDDPPRWLLVTREAAVPDGVTAARWSADHLLLDQYGVPTIVEVKRSTDTRIRREIVGQMLDYAANATKHWPTDQIRAFALKEYGSEEALEAKVRSLIALQDPEKDTAISSYWAEVEANLKSGRLRLLFVSDSIPSELRRVIEFLNQHLPTIEVLGVELALYQNGGMRALVPRVFGRTERLSEGKTRPGGKGQTDDAEFLAANPPWAEAFFVTLFAQVLERGLLLKWGTKGFSVRARRPDGTLITVLTGYPPGALNSAVPFLEVSLERLSPAENPESLRKSLVAIDGFEARGNHTVHLDLAQNNVSHAVAGLPAIWEAYRRIEGPAAG